MVVDKDPQIQEGVLHRQLAVDEEGDEDQPNGQGDQDLSVAPTVVTGGRKAVE